MTDVELEKKAFEHREKIVPYAQLGYPDLEIPVYSALHINQAYIAGGKEMQEENQQLRQQLENEKQLNAEIKKRLVEVEYDCEDFNHEYCDLNCKGKRKELVDLYQLISDGLNETLLKQKEDELEELKEHCDELELINQKVMEENERLKTDLEYAKAIMKDLLNNSHEYSRQNAEDFIKGEKK